ncbi:MAG: NUDIX hydrolase [Bryobacteraceae bacterium]
MQTPAKRLNANCREETGYKAKKWSKLSSYFASPGFLEERMTIFLAQDLMAGDQEPMEDERIELKWVTDKELDGLVEDGRIQDGKTIIGYLTWKRYHTGRRAARSSL